jgi:hypothetical protein
MTADRMTRAQELSMLLEWNGLLVNGHKRTVDTLWASDEVGSAVLLANIKDLAKEKKDWQHAAESLFLQDVDRTAKIEGANWDDDDAPEGLRT